MQRTRFASFQSASPHAGRSIWEGCARFLGAAAVIFLGCHAVDGATIDQPSYHNRLFAPDCCLVISHAAGSIKGRPYTNSREALDANFSIGRRVFEIDFSLTSDGVLALVHDWTYWQNLSAENREISWPDETMFLARGLQGGLSAMMLPDLVAWLDDHPDAVVITDTKDDFSDFAKAFFAEDVAPERFVFQIYDFDDLDLLRSYTETAEVILTTYKRTFDAEDLIANLEDSDIDALTMPLPKAKKALADIRRSLPNLPIYVHGRPGSINAAELHFYLQELGATGFYLD